MIHPLMHRFRVAAFPGSAIVFSLAATATLALQILLPIAAVAENRESFTVNQTIGDGRDGRIFRQWRQKVQEKPIEKVEVVMNRTKGVGETFVNLRFQDGPALDFGKRVQLTDDNPKTVRWDVGKQFAGHKPLVLNIYNGEAQITAVNVFYGTNTDGTVVRISKDGKRRVEPAAPEKNPEASGTKAAATDNNRAKGGKAAVGDPVKLCKTAEIRPPKIEILSVTRLRQDETSETFQIRGEVAGTCLQEGGYYENSQLVQVLPCQLRLEPTRQEFTLTVHTRRNAEIRITTSNGREESVLLDELVAVKADAPVDTGF